ncbi:helix-turn-helix domain-containing protein [Bremerella cremea]|uniref:helix-turn-helix domain-containing protein n=1 Tax=Bremerella cremea TaxID=1031537 RepID=UPI0031F0A8DC
MSKEARSDPRQTTIDWTRAQRLKFLDELELPKMPGTTPAKMLAVLRCLESHCREQTSCRVRSDTIAAKVNTTSRSVRRALASLEELGVVTRKRTGRSSMYQISWPNLQSHVPRVVAREEAAVSDQSGHHVRSDRTPCPIRVDTVSDQIGRHVRSTEAYFETKQETPPPPPLEAEATWHEAEGAVARCDVGRVREAIDRAQHAGVGPAYVLACVAMVEASAGAFGGGALLERLRQASPHVPPEAIHAWPPPRPLTAREAKACRLLAALAEHSPGEGWTENLRQRFERIAQTDPQRAPPDQAMIAARYGCPFTTREVARAWFQLAAGAEIDSPT